MNQNELFQKHELSPRGLEGEINAETPVEFVTEFRSVFSCPLAKKIRGVVYIWSTKSGIPRMKGDSNIIYIGKTIGTINERHYRYAELEGEGMNWARYRYIINKFGPISVEIAQCDDPRDEERKLLRSYFEEHLELPPINASG